MLECLSLKYKNRHIARYHEIWAKSIHEFSFNTLLYFSPILMMTDYVNKFKNVEVWLIDVEFKVSRMNKHNGSKISEARL